MVVVVVPRSITSLTDFPPSYPPRRPPHNLTTILLTSSPLASLILDATALAAAPLPSSSPHFSLSLLYLSPSKSPLQTMPTLSHHPSSHPLTALFHHPSSLAPGLSSLTHSLAFTHHLLPTIPSLLLFSPPPSLSLLSTYHSVPASKCCARRRREIQRGRRNNVCRH